jgi:hypothetical protein
MKEQSDVTWFGLRRFQQALGSLLTTLWLLAVLGLRFGLHRRAEVIGVLFLDSLASLVAVGSVVLALHFYHRGPYQTGSDQLRGAVLRVWVTAAIGCFLVWGIYLFNTSLVCLGWGVLTLGLIHWFTIPRLRRAWERSA